MHALQSVKAAMSPEEVLAVIKETRELKERQVRHIVHSMSM